MTIMGIEMLKRAGWFPWLSQHSDTANRIVSWILALVSSAGLKFASSGSIGEGGTITIAFPAVGEIVDGVLHFAGQGGLQEGLYRALVKPFQPTKAAEEVRVGAATKAAEVQFERAETASRAEAATAATAVSAAAISGAGGSANNGD